MLFLINLRGNSAQDILTSFRRCLKNSMFFIFKVFITIIRPFKLNNLLVTHLLRRLLSSMQTTLTFLYLLNKLFISLKLAFHALLKLIISFRAVTAADPLLMIRWIPWVFKAFIHRHFKIDFLNLKECKYYYCYFL